MDGSATNDIMFPPLPPLQGEILLEIYTHKSLGKLVGLKDNERYVVLGTKAFELAVTQCVFKQNPEFSSKEIEDEVKKLVSDENFQIWASQYKLREKLRYNPADKDAVLAPEGAREIFLAYMGGVYDQPNGFALLLSWVMQAFFPSTTTKPSEHESGNDLEVNLNHHNNIPFNGLDKINPYSTNGLDKINPYATNVLDKINQYATNDESPPMLPFHKPRPDPTHFSESPRSSLFSIPLKRDVPPHMTHGFIPRPSVTYLPRFNEITTRRRLDVQWLAEQTGMQHAPLWTIQCYVNGRVYGTGTGTTKQLAKEEAAKEAYSALGLDG